MSTVMTIARALFAGIPRPRVVRPGPFVRVACTSRRRAAKRCPAGLVPEAGSSRGGGG